MIRKAIDIILTVNLIVVGLYIAYLWQAGVLTVNYNHEPEVVRVEQSIYDVFTTTLKQEVNRERGVPIEGYEPQMYLAAFPGLTKSDFNKVEASIGYYQIIDGQLRQQIDQGELIHSAAAAINRRGMRTLLDNVAERLQVDLQNDGTITEIMDAISA